MNSISPEEFTKFTEITVSMAKDLRLSDPTLVPAE
jgi:hypothetical protein